MTDLTFDPAALRALLDAATPGPWAHEHDGGHIVHHTEGTVAEAEYAPDAKLIAALRNQGTDLLGALAAAREELAEVTRELNAFMHARIQGDDMAARVTWLSDELVRVEAERDFWKSKRHPVVPAAAPQAKCSRCGGAGEMDAPIGWVAICGQCDGSGAAAPQVDDLIERSSLGTPEAVALRASVDDETARRIVARAAALADEPQDWWWDGACWHAVPAGQRVPPPMQLCTDKAGPHGPHGWRPDLDALVECPGLPTSGQA